MTTTLRPTEPLQRTADGLRSRHYQVCVNSRPVGAIHLGTSPSLGESVARILDLRIEEPDRRRGRGTVAALAAEEVARGWGCRQIEAIVPEEAPTASRLATNLGYVLRNRIMAKPLSGAAPELPVGSRARPMTGDEFETWRAHESQAYAQEWIERGLPEAEAYAKSRRDHAHLQAGGVATAGNTFSVLEHEGDRVGVLWLGWRGGDAFVYDVEVDADRRGHGHGRTLMLLAEVRASAGGSSTLGLNVFAGNTPAERLYESLGYETRQRVFYKHLL
ncbi:GNAT family N-acetyltransferase [Streptomyces adustus]|uniref:GNAT family N-acetyltransferase n=1 Tax=Streptomyces adustus TaxID=1609272 RepID=A0A5N8VTB2_9ACTN|nr:GNAT family N-acetyltransferase [Streptomyces adustus]MPY37175.1 GNAT family N-acetyltransferase [Streptomyces adustus]